MNSQNGTATDEEASARVGTMHWGALAGPSVAGGGRGLLGECAAAEGGPMLTEGQVRYFEALGFIVLRRWFSGEEIDGIGGAFDDVMEEARQGGGVQR